MQRHTHFKNEHLKTIKLRKGLPTQLHPCLIVSNSALNLILLNASKENTNKELPWNPCLFLLVIFQDLFK